MRITIHFDLEKNTDYARSEMKAEHRILDINFDGEKLESYSDYMGDYDKNEAVDCIRAALLLYEKKEALK